MTCRILVFPLPEGQIKGQILQRSKSVKARTYLIYPSAALSVVGRRRATEGQLEFIWLGQLEQTYLPVVLGGSHGDRHSLYDVMRWERVWVGLARGRGDEEGPAEMSRRGRAREVRAELFEVKGWTELLKVGAFDLIESASSIRGEFIRREGTLGRWTGCGLAGRGQRGGLASSLRTVTPAQDPTSPPVASRESRFSSSTFAVSLTVRLKPFGSTLAAMFYYLSFLRPPPVSSPVNEQLVLTPQVANDLRTEL